MVQIDFNLLIQRIARSKDRQAFEALFSHYGPKLKSFAMKRGAGAAAAEDLVQETMVRVWRKAESFDPSLAGASAWIFSIARNLQVDLARKTQRSGIFVDEPVEIEDPHKPDDHLLASESQLLVAQALQRLPAEQHQLIRLAFFEDKSQSEIASISGIPLGTIKSRLRLAYGKLRQLLEDLK